MQRLLSLWYHHEVDDTIMHSGNVPEKSRTSYQLLELKKNHPIACSK